jgi:hypothetical protein
MVCTALERSLLGIQPRCLGCARVIRLRRWTPPAMLNVPEARLRSRAAPSSHGLTVQFHH